MTGVAIKPTVGDGRRRTAFLMSLIVVAMTAIAFASVPLYRLFCDATGFQGTTQRGNGLGLHAVAGSSVEIRFDANHVAAIPWSFAPEKPSMMVRLGEKNIAFFTATNHARYPVTGSAKYNVQPNQAGSYFSKIQCFCFNEQTLQAGQTVRMPVIFYVNADLAKDPDTRDVETITLSYTFYPVDGRAPRS